MALKSILKPEGSIMAGLATAALVVGIYSLGVGNVAQVHATPSSDPNIRAARRKAATTAAVAVSAVSLLTKDVTILILGGGVLVLYDWHVRHADAADHLTGALALGGYLPAEQAVPVAQQAPAVAYA